MKKMITISLLLCCFCMAGHSQETDLPTVCPPPVIKLGGVDYIQYNKSLVLSFNQSLGGITITIWGKDKVYSKPMYAVSGTRLTIPTSGWANIDHSICITDCRGMVIATFTVSIQN